MRMFSNSDSRRWPHFGRANSQLLMCHCLLHQVSVDDNNKYSFNSLQIREHESGLHSPERSHLSTVKKMDFLTDTFFYSRPNITLIAL